MAKTRDAEDLIRELLVRELDTVNVYSEMIGRAKTPAVRELLTEITRQEKHHIAEAMDMLARIDAGQARALIRAGLGRPITAATESVSIVFDPSGLAASPADGDTLLEAAKAAGVEIRNDCGGHGVCGTCRVEVIEGAESLSKLTAPERKHLDELLAEGWRLACQTTASSAVRVRVPALERAAGSDVK
ncbi:MAG: 2Fe-2S iron-sulfur cluster-binding protein [Blastocatellia bacterium]|jgi:ferredoxin